MVLQFFCSLALTCLLLRSMVEPLVFSNQTVTEWVRFLLHEIVFFQSPVSLLFSTVNRNLTGGVVPYATSPLDWIDRIIANRHGYEALDDENVPITPRHHRYVNIAPDGSLNIPPYLRGIVIEFQQTYENTRYNRLQRFVYYVRGTTKSNVERLGYWFCATHLNTYSKCRGSKKIGVTGVITGTY